MIIGLPEDWGKWRLQSWRTQTKFCVPRGEEQGPNRRLNQNYLLVEGPPVEVWVSRGSPEGWGNWKVPLA